MLVREADRDPHDLALLHQRDRLKRVTLAPLLTYTLEDLVDADGGDDVHKRSPSRGTSVSIPRRKPRICFTGTMGSSSMRSPY